MKKIALLISFLFFASVFIYATNTLNGEWKGTRYQFDESKSKYIAEFDYIYSLTQKDKKVEGTVVIQSKSHANSKANINVRGFVEGDKFYFEEYEITKSTIRDGYVWCLKKGVLDIKEENGKLVLSGKTPSFMAVYGLECSGGFTYLSKEKPLISDEEINVLANKNENPLNINVYPNPFVTETKITFNLDKKQDIVVDVVDINGRVLEVLMQQTCTAGTHTILYNPKDNHNSTYFYVRILIEGQLYTRAIQKYNAGGSTMR